MAGQPMLVFGICLRRPKPGPGEVLRRNIMAVSGSKFRMTVSERYTTTMTLL
jgi:hypothetical protein